MTISTILAIAFGWLFVNTWLSLIFIKMTSDFVSTWVDLLCLFIMSVLSPFPFLLLRWFFQLKRKLKKWKLF
jgi:hypothetical protein